MEVKIGVQYAARELVIDSAQTPDEVQEAVTEALNSDQGILSLLDEKGRRLIIPVSKLAYIEIAEQNVRTVGFHAG